MQRSQDQFFLQRGGEIRESLIMIEGDDGSFELLAHGWLAGKDGDDGSPFALVRSRNTGRVHLLVHETDRDPRHIYHWHRIRTDSLRALQDRIVRLRGTAAPEVARRSNWIVSASEKAATKVNAVVRTDCST
jgi:hypothetical protein